MKTKTDASGRYEIHGARKAEAYMLELASDPKDGYVACQFFTADTTGYEPVIADIKVKKGVVITGKVIDKTTGKGIPGWAYVQPLNGNAFVKDYPSMFSSAWVGFPEAALRIERFNVRCAAPHSSSPRSCFQEFGRGRANP